MHNKSGYAAEEGQPFLPLAPNDTTEVAAVDVSDLVEVVIPAAPERWDFIVESEAEGVGIGTVLERLGKRDHVRIWVAGGQMAVPGLVRHLQAEQSHQVVAIIEADAPARIVDQLQREMPQHPQNLVIARYERRGLARRRMRRQLRQRSSSNRHQAKSRAALRV